MPDTQAQQHPVRITDLVESKRRGAIVTCDTAFTILPVDFQHRANPFRAHLFLCRYSGAIDGRAYAFRKCYARGCPNNLCPHVSQAVQIANRYLQRDYHHLKRAGIEIEEKLFELSEMLLQFDRAPSPGAEIRTLPDLIASARVGQRVSIDAALSFMPAVEHFDRQQQAQTFLIGEFAASVDADRCMCERCFACYPTDGDPSERTRAIATADARLDDLYRDLEQAGIACQRRYFRTV